MLVSYILSISYVIGGEDNMKIVIFLLCTLSILFGLLNGNMDKVNLAAINGCKDAVTLVLTLIGSISLWSGLMEIAEKSGLTNIIAKMLSPLICRIFKGVKKGSKALKLITMNITANMLGLGNAATPLGLSAMEELNKALPDKFKGVASDDMVNFVVINTCSVQLIPTTVAVLRAKYGANKPLDIILPVLIVSIVSLIIGLITSKFLSRFFKIKPLGERT